jgi:F0F1-type ATP synthase epsilon subunit
LNEGAGKKKKGKEEAELMFFFFGVLDITSANGSLGAETATGQGEISVDVFPKARTRERKRELARSHSEKWRGHVLLRATATHRMRKIMNKRAQYGGAITR